MRFLNLTLFLHIIVGGFMITNPALFENFSKSGVGFTVPTLPLNPGEELQRSVGILSADESEFNELKDDGLTKIITKISDRMQYFHQ